MIITISGRAGTGKSAVGKALAKKLDVEIRYEKGDFKGGFCRVNDKQFIVLQKNELPYKNVEILARELRQFDLENVYLLPALREIIEMENEKVNHLGDAHASIRVS